MILKLSTNMMFAIGIANGTNHAKTSENIMKKKMQENNEAKMRDSQNKSRERTFAASNDYILKQWEPHKERSKRVAWNRMGLHETMKKHPIIGVTSQPMKRGIFY